MKVAFTMTANKRPLTAGVEFACGPTRLFNPKSFPGMKL